MEQVITGLSGDEVPVESVITNLLHSVRKAEMIRERRVHTQLVNVVSQQTVQPYANNHKKNTWKRAQKLLSIHRRLSLA